jgi:acetylornithine deacetylase/succinyl-diaminopimelate desuccinylase-like protein
MEKGPLGDAMRAWLANPNDGDAADAIEASESEVGLTRTRCVPTRLFAGHADNALPQLARSTVNCRIFPGVDPATVLATLRQLGQPDNVTVEPVDIARPTDASPLRPDVVGAYTAAVRARHPNGAVTPDMSTGATDGLYFRARGVPVYGVDGSWAVIPADERAHGRDERLPVRAFYDDVDHWTDLIRRLAG